MPAHCPECHRVVVHPDEHDPGCPLGGLDDLAVEEHAESLRREAEYERWDERRQFDKAC